MNANNKRVAFGKVVISQEQVQKITATAVSLINRIAFVNK
jgi:hypothetical protein